MSEETSNEKIPETKPPTQNRKAIEEARIDVFMEMAAQLSSVGDAVVDPHGFQCGCVTKKIEDERRRILNALDALMMEPEPDFIARLAPHLGPVLAPVLLELGQQLINRRKDDEAPPPDGHDPVDETVFVESNKAHFHEVSTETLEELARTLADEIAKRKAASPPDVG